MAKTETKEANKAETNEKSIFSYINRFRLWLFLIGTRVVEAFNALALSMFSLVMLFNYNVLIHLPTFSAFAVVGEIKGWIAMLLLAVVQVIAMLKCSNRSNQLSGYVLMVSGAIWVIITSIFASAPTLTTAPFTYGTLATFCLLAGYDLMTINKQIEHKQREAAANEDK